MSIKLNYFFIYAHQPSVDVTNLTVYLLSDTNSYRIRYNLASNRAINQTQINLKEKKLY